MSSTRLVTLTSTDTWVLLHYAITHALMHTTRPPEDLVRVICQCVRFLPPGEAHTLADLIEKDEDWAAVHTMLRRHAESAPL